MKVNFGTREICAVDRNLYKVSEELTSTNVLINLDDGSEVIRFEIWQDKATLSFRCHIALINEKLNIRIASHARGFQKAIAIDKAFKNAKISLDPPVKPPEVPTFRYPMLKETLESIAQELGVTRHTIVASGSDPL